MKKWADAHGLTVKENVSKYILGANGIVVQIVDMTSMSVLLVLTLELDMANIAIRLGGFYQGLLLCDVLCGHSEVLGPATIALPFPD